MTARSEMTDSVRSDSAQVDTAPADSQYLVVENVSKSYGATQALNPLTLSLVRGELVTLLGPSGCGKTTLLRIVAGFTASSTGRVLLDGRDLTPLPPARRRMGMVFQAYSLFPNLNAEDNVRFGLTVRGVSRAESEKKLGEYLTKKKFF